MEVVHFVVFKTLNSFLYNYLLHKVFLFNYSDMMLLFDEITLNGFLSNFLPIYKENK